MLEINQKQLQSFNNLNKARILKLIALGQIKYIESNIIEEVTNEKD